MPFMSYNVRSLSRFFVFLIFTFVAQAQQYGVTVSRAGKNVKIVLATNSSSHTLDIVCDDQGNVKEIPTSDFFNIKTDGVDKLDIHFSDQNNSLHALFTKNNLEIDKLSFKDGLNLTTQALVTFKGDTLCEGDLSVKARDVVVSGSLSCEDFNVRAASTFYTTGTLYCRDAHINAAVIKVHEGGNYRIRRDLFLEAAYCLLDGMVEIRGEGKFFTSKLLNQNLLSVKGDLVVICDPKVFQVKSHYKEEQFFNNYENGRVEAFGQMKFFIPEGFVRNYSGSIISRGPISIKANRLEMTNHGITTHREQDVETNEDWCYPYSQSLNSGAGFMVSMHGDVDLDLIAGNNLASVIQAGKTLKIKAHTFTNGSMLLEQTTCEKITRPDGYWFGFIESSKTDIEPVKSTDYVPAMLVARDGIEVLINGLASSYKEKGFFVGAPTFYNSGRVGSSSHLYVTSDDGKGSWINGQQSTRDLTLIKKSQQPSLVSIPLHAMATHSGSNPHFVNVHPFFRQEAPFVPRSHMLFVDGYSYTGKERELMAHSFLGEQVMRMALEFTDSSYFDSAQGVSLIETVSRYFDAGIKHGLTMGKLKPVPSFKDNGPVFPLDHTGQALALYKNGFLATKDNSVANVYSMMHKLALLEQGSHYLAVPEKYITKAPSSFLYVKPELCDKSRMCLRQILHIAKPDYEHNSACDGVVQTGRLITNNLRKFENKGTIIALDKVEIGARTIVNEKRQSKSTVHTNKGIAKEYTIRLPQPGGEIYGLTITLHAAGDTGKHKGGIKNKGGTIAGRQEVKLYSQNGDTILEPLIVDEVMMLDQSFWDKLTNKAVSDKTEIYKGGVVSSDEDSVSLVSEVGHFINKASSVVAKENINIKGYLGVLSQTLLSSYIGYSSTNREKLTWETITAEAALEARAHYKAKNKNVSSEKGAHTDRASKNDVQKETSECAAGEIKENVSIKLKEATNSFGATLLSYFVKEKEKKTDHIVELIPAKELSIITPESVFFRGVLLMDGMIINIIAGKDVSIQSAVQETEETETEISLGISFTGSDYLQGALDKDIKKVTEALLATDPLVAALANIVRSKDLADGAANSVQLLMQTLNDAYAAMGEKAADSNVIRELGKRYSLLDGNGNLKMNMSCRLGLKKTSSKNSKAYASGDPANVNTFNVQAGGDLKVEQPMNAENAKLEADSIVMGGVEESQEHSATSAGVSGNFGTDGFGTVGVDASHGTNAEKSTSHNHYNFGNAEFKTNKLHIKNADLHAESIKGTIGKVTVESTTTHTESESMSASVSAGANSGSGSVGYASENADQVKEAASFSGHSDGLHIGTLESKGGFVDVTGGASVDSFESSDVEEQTTKKGFNLGVKVAPAGTTLFGGSADVGFTNKKDTSKIQATASERSDFVTNDQDGLNKFNRDVEKVRVQVSSKGGHYRIFVPFVDTKNFADLFKRLRRAKTPQEEAEIKAEMNSQISLEDLPEVEESSSNKKQNTKKTSADESSDNHESHEYSESFEEESTGSENQEKPSSNQDEPSNSGGHEEPSSEWENFSESSRNSDEQSTNTENFERSENQDSFNDEQQQAATENSAHQATSENKPAENAAADIPIVYGTVNGIDAKGISQETMVYGIPAELRQEYEANLAKAFLNGEVPSHFKYLHKEYDPETHFYYYRFQVVDSQGRAVDAGTQANNRMQMVHTFAKYYPFVKAAVDFTGSFTNRYIEVNTGLRIPGLSSIIDEGSPAGLLGQAAGISLGLAQSAAEFNAASVGYMATTAQVVGAPFAVGTTVATAAVTGCASVLCSAHATFMVANAARISTREIKLALASNAETMADVFNAIHTSVHESSEVKTKEVESLRRVNLNELSRETGLDKITLSRVLQEMISARMTKPAQAEVPQGCQNIPSASLPPSHTIPIIPDSTPTSYTFPKLEEKKPNVHSQPKVDLPTHTSIPIPDSTRIEDIISHAESIPDKKEKVRGPDWDYSPPYIFEELPKALQDILTGAAWPEGVPTDWIRKPSDKKDGVIFTNPRSEQEDVRFMPGNKHAPWPGQRKPFVSRTINGKKFDVNNNELKTPKCNESHIAFELFKFILGK